MAKVAHLTSVHVPLDIRIFHKECKTLVKAGYDVVLIVPNDQPTGIEAVDGVRIRSLPKPRTRRTRMTGTIWNVYRHALREDADIYHFHDPELIVAGLLLKLRGKRVIYDVHEDLPRQILTKHWIPARARGLVSRGAEAVEFAGAMAWDGIAAATPTIARRFPPGKTALVQNFPVPGELMPVTPSRYEDRSHLVAYVGKIEGIRGAREMVAAMSALPPSVEACLAMAGVFEPARLETELRQQEGWSRIHPMGWLTRPEVSALLGRARIGLVLLHPAGNYIDAQPNKLFEYMAAGIPVVASDFPRWRTLIEDVSCGLLVDPLDPSAIAAAIQWLLKHPDEAAAMGQRGQAAIRDTYNWAAEGERLIGLYRDCLKGGPSG